VPCIKSSKRQKNEVEMRRCRNIIVHVVQNKRGDNEHPEKSDADSYF